MARHGKERIDNEVQCKEQVDAILLIKNKNIMIQFLILNNTIIIKI